MNLLDLINYLYGQLESAKVEADALSLSTPRNIELDYKRADAIYRRLVRIVANPGVSDLNFRDVSPELLKQLTVLKDYRAEQLNKERKMSSLADLELSMALQAVYQALKMVKESSDATSVSLTVSSNGYHTVECQFEDDYANPQRVSLEQATNLLSLGVDRYFQRELDRCRRIKNL